MSVILIAQEEHALISGVTRNVMEPHVGKNVLQHHYQPELQQPELQLVQLLQRQEQLLSAGLIAAHQQTVHAMMFGVTRNVMQPIVCKIGRRQELPQEQEQEM